MKSKKYKELFKLKGLMREKNISYKKLSQLIGINVTTFSDKINGYSVFTLIEVNKIVEKLEIEIENIPEYFF